MIKVAIAAGGTGGHVFPALAVAVELHRRGLEVLWIGSRQGIENRLPEMAPFLRLRLPVGGFRGRRVLQALWSLVMAAFSLLICWLWMLRHKPRALLAMGGYVSVPAGFAALCRRCPTVLHEQNARPGLANRLLAGRASALLETWAGSFDLGGRWVGMPVRPAIAALPAPAARGLGTRPSASENARLLILGGSQGASFLNSALPAVLARLDVPLSIHHLCGRGKLEETVRAYQGCGVKAEVEEFSDRMEQLYGWADLAVARSGASTLAELMAAGLGAVLVPYPSAADDHQRANACRLVEAEGARLVLDGDEEGLHHSLSALLADPSLLLSLAGAARALARPRAAAEIADVLEEQWR